MPTKKEYFYNSCQKCGDHENSEKYSVLGHVPNNLTSGFHIRLCPKCARELGSHLRVFTQNWLKKDKIH